MFIENLHFKIILLLTFLVRVFFSVDLSRPSETVTIRNDMFSAHGLFNCLFSLSGKARCFILLYMVAKCHNFHTFVDNFETLRHFIKQKLVKCPNFTLEYEDEKRNLVIAGGQYRQYLPSSYIILFYY